MRTTHIPISLLSVYQQLSRCSSLGMSDGYHNLYAQLHGRKRFVLAPPSAWPLLRAHPFLHPSHAQCHAALDLDAADEPTAAALVAAGARVVDLARGDVLYLPPLWFHETLSLRGGSDGGGEATWSGVSVNGWVECDEGAAAEAIFAMPRPVDEDARGDGGAAAALVALLSAECFEEKPSHLTSRVWAERYSSLVNQGQLPTSDGLTVVECAAMRRWRAAWGAHPAARAWARDVAGVAMTRMSEASRGTWLSNLAELVAAEIIGVERTGGFWRDAAACG